MMTKKDMKNVVSGWGGDPTHRMILGLTIALDGAIAESEEDHPYNYVKDIQNLLASIWEAVRDKEINKQLRIKYEKELAPATDLNVGMFFYCNKEHQPNSVSFDNINGFETDNFDLDPASEETLRDSIKTAAEDWAKQYKKFISGKKG